MIGVVSHYSYHYRVSNNKVMYRITVLIVICCSISVCLCENDETFMKNNEDLINVVLDDCVLGNQPFMSCTRAKTLSFVNGLIGVREDRNGKSLSDEDADNQLWTKIGQYIQTHEYKLHLPEFVFQEAILTYRPGRSLSDFDVEFPENKTDEDRSMSEARDLLKKKLLLPLLMLVKLKLKAITPIMLILVGIKAMKAFVMSKISLLVVIVFLIMQLCKKAGMPMPMAMNVGAPPTEPPIIYGPAPTPPPYGAPAATPDTSYGSWEPSNNNGGNGPYARWDSHNLAYSSYQQDNTKPPS